MPFFAAARRRQVRMFARRRVHVHESAEPAIQFPHDAGQPSWRTGMKVPSYR